MKVKWKKNPCSDWFCENPRLLFGINACFCYCCANRQSDANSKEIYMQWKWKPLWWIYVWFDSRIHTANANACSRVWLWFDLDALGCWVFVYLWHIFSCCLASISFLVRSAASICVHCNSQPICAETIRAEKKKKRMKYK